MKFSLVLSLIALRIFSVKEISAIANQLNKNIHFIIFLKVEQSSIRQSWLLSLLDPAPAF